MTLFSAFSIQFGASLLTSGAMAAWIFRQSDAPLFAKIVAPCALVAMAITMPLQVYPMLGYPVEVDFKDLPQIAELIAFVPHDDDKLVDIWLRSGDGSPRAYTTKLDDKLKKTLREAGTKLGHGERVAMAKGGNIHQGYTDLQAAAAPYQLRDDIFAMPEKNNQ